MTKLHEYELAREHNFCDHLELGKPHQIKFNLLGWSFDANVVLRKNARGLVVMLPSIRANVASEPEFLRFAWAEHISNMSFLSVEDPTCKLGPMNGGFFLGKLENYPLDVLAKAVECICRSLQCSTTRVLFYGSSSGGLNALQLAATLSGAAAIAEIPTVDLRKIHWPQAVARALRPGYGNLTVNDVYCIKPERITALDTFLLHKRVPNHLVIHSISDKANQNNIYNYLAALPDVARKCGASGLMRFEAHALGEGHSALSGKLAIPRLRCFIETLDGW
jgi:hypothetical protein